MKLGKTAFIQINVVISPHTHLLITPLLLPHFAFVLKPKALFVVIVVITFFCFSFIFSL